MENTHSDAAEAAEFGAVWTEASIPELLHADEAAEHLCNALWERHAHLPPKPQRQKHTDCV